MKAFKLKKNQAIHLITPLLIMGISQISAAACNDSTDWQTVGSYNESSNHAKAVGVITNSNNMAKCTATLIAKDLVLTSPHCFQGEPSETNRYFVHFDYQTNSVSPNDPDSPFDSYRLLESVEYVKSAPVYAIYRITEATDIYPIPIGIDSEPDPADTLTVIQHTSKYGKVEDTASYDRGFNSDHMYFNHLSIARTSHRYQGLGSSLLNSQGYLISLVTHGGCSAFQDGNDSARATSVAWLAKYSPIIAVDMFVTRLYQEMLKVYLYDAIGVDGYEGFMGGYHFWTEEIIKGNMSAAFVASFFADRISFHELTDENEIGGTISDDEFVDRAYRAILGRDPTTTEKDTGVSDLTNNLVDRNAFSRALALSPEFVNKFAIIQSNESDYHLPSKFFGP